ncbi:hypothetical protein Asppvi_002246 [Aspergillus pseudoviridinutans]|uniref:Uncharacterized protein n=1 Tax=Aspergillus pseudoviridinutans TaxID=1517512 RepID=A0A9P3EPV2_9EURO|nr:uncharacterized protein Asppvi_002246 [Aspergillus pseudoviridinutans]GIJ83426.1 hypothetical protein Asppvi_002246 [Aspergillus pseudoviridinutans]
MSPGSARTAESSVLGESWVVASTSSLQKKHLPEESDRNAPPNQEDERKGCQSMTTSASSISGPELIMPSICEVPISEASWVAPELRSRTLSAHTVKRRHKRLSDRSGKKRESEASSSEDSTTARRSQEDKIVSISSGTTSSPARIERYIRPLINLLLMIAISHLLILPELVHQYQTLCSIGAVSALYPASCIPPYPQPPSTNPQMQSHPNPILTSQSRLESLFNTTLTQMSVLHPTLQQTESLLRDLHTNLKKAYPATKHELDLEFAGCTQAARTATGKFASLKADIHSAMDSLLATAATDDSTGTGRGRGRSVAQDARLSTQLARREAYLDQLTARMQSKAEALCGDFATLDDHLESIQEIVQRELRAASSLAGFETTAGKRASDVNAEGLWGFIERIVPFTGRTSSVRTREDKTSTSEMRADTHVSDSLRQATNHHRPVADLIRRLYIDLQNLQRKKGNLV